MILIQSEPSALRALTHAAASSGPVSVSTGIPNCVPWPSGAVAVMPAEKRSASVLRPTSSRAGRFAAAKAGSVDWSSTVVTPERSASFSVEGKLCTWPSISPGISV